MNTTIYKLKLMLVIAGVCCLADSASAHNVTPMPWIVPSPGVVSATAITIDASDAEWPASATSFTIADYGSVVGMEPLSASVKVLHKADGIYLFLTIDDESNNGNDAVQIRFDVNHNGSPIESLDWGVQVLRNGQVTWGALDNDAWSVTPAPGGTAAVSGPGTSPWTAEIRVPTGAPTGIDLTTSVVGIHFMLYDVDQVFGLNNAKYTQWPEPTLMEMPDGIDSLFDNDPSRWGHYEFDMATTFPDVTLTEVRNVYDGAENYRKISYTETNIFQVTANNPGGTAVAEPSNVRLNLYLAARGIGEPWHRLDAEDLINSDCAAPTWASSEIAKSNVCSGSSSLDDISAMNINDVVLNNAKYTTKLGTPMNRLGGESITLPVGSLPIDVIAWNTTSAQDDFYKEVEVNGTTYRRQHQCMKAEAIVPGDPNPGNNTRQVNMDFVSVSEMKMKMFMFSLGSAGFGKYDPAIGKKMFLNLATHNINPELGWEFAVKGKGIEQVGKQTWVAEVRGKESLAVEFGIAAPHGDRLGKPIKRNLMIPPQAGGNQPNAAEPSGEAPVYVKVNSGSTIQVVNYSFELNDEQFVDLDGRGELFRANGPAGYNPSKIIKKYDAKRLIAPNLAVGALIGSFDNFKTAFLVAEGIQVNVPTNATHLALGINDFAGMYKDNAGTGFRVKVMEVRTQTAVLEKGKPAVSFEMLPSAQAMSSSPPAKERLDVIPIHKVTPTVCLQGYESIEQVRVVGDNKRELYRFIGDVCWGVLNVYDPERPYKPGETDKGDTFTEVKPSLWQRIFNR